MNQYAAFLMLFAGCEGATVELLPDASPCIPACEVRSVPLSAGPDPSYVVEPACCDPDQFDAANYPYDHENGLCVPFLDGGACR